MDNALGLVLVISLPCLHLYIMFSIMFAIQKIAKKAEPKNIASRAFLELLGQEDAPVVFSFEALNGYNYTAKIREHDITTISAKKLVLPENCKELKIIRS